MVAKKATETKHKSTRHVATPVTTDLPDIFDEDSQVGGQARVESPRVEEEPAQVVPEIDLPAPRAPSVRTEVVPELSLPEQDEMKATESPAPSREAQTFTVRQNGKEVEQKLPDFFVPDTDTTPTAVEPKGEALTQTNVLESVVPQAFVGEVRQVAGEVQSEKKGTKITALIILGLLLLAGGVIGLLSLNAKRGENQKILPTPTPMTQVEATPTPTPTIVIKTATQSASVDPGLWKSLRVHVLNGTTVKGLAAKEAAVIKKLGFTIASVGNGEVARAGTIVVPEGKLDAGEAIQAGLENYVFTVSEDPKAKELTVVLGTPNP